MSVDVVRYFGGNMDDFLQRARLNELFYSCQPLGTVCSQAGKDPETL